MIFFSSEVTEYKTILFKALEEAEVYGSCNLDLSGKNAVLNSLTYDLDKPYIAEGLVKTAFNYAAKKNFYMGECSCENISDLLLRLGFQKKGNIYISDIPSILMGSCCKK